MERNRNLSVNNCSLQNVRPIMVDLPYPPIQVRGRNPRYAELLQVDYCGSVSELSAVLQYINNENRMSDEHCSLIRTCLLYTSDAADELHRVWRGGGGGAW